MGKVMLITINIFKRMLKKPSAFMLYILLPIVTSIGMFILFSLDGNDKMNIAVVDLDNTVLSRSVIKSIENTNGFNIIDTPQELLEKHIADRYFSFGYVIPKGFEKTILSGSNPNIDVVSIDINTGTSWIKEITNFHIDNLKAVAKASGYQKREMFAMLDSIQKGAVSINAVYVNDESKVKSATVRTFGNYMIFLMITTFLIAFKILEEKRSGTFARIGMSPVHPKSYTFANILANLIVVMVQVGLVMLALKFLLGIEFFASPLIIYLVLIIFALCGISLGVLIAAFSKNSTMAGALMGMVVSPSCALAGCFWPIEFMPGYMQKISYITPQRWTLDAIELIQKNNSFVEILPNLIVVLSFTFLFFLVTIYRFKATEATT